jgi:hypothetical protein
MFRLLAELIWGFLTCKVIDRVLSAVMPKGSSKGSPFDNPVYKKNVQALIERNRRFEKAE